MMRMLEPASQAMAASDDAILRCVAREMKPGVSAAEAWQKSFDVQRRRGGCMDALTGADCGALKRFFEHLGEVGREQQELQLDGVVKALEQNLESADADAAQTERLYSSLGLLVGLMLALIVI